MKVYTKCGEVCHIFMLAFSLDVHFIHTLPVFVALRHSRASGNPGGKRHEDWLPAFAGMTFD